MAGWEWSHWLLVPLPLLADRAAQASTCGQEWWVIRNLPPHTEPHSVKPLSAECFAIDHEGVMVPEQRPRSRVSGDYTLFGSGYPNPAYTGPTV